ncbi:MAG TPA: PPK2 family polyphosphate kinase [Gemmatimonadaceae bacterium]|nr:PPK2 family polyphosphate kinase [Gemmatimonadaceae bacterium]
MKLKPVESKKDIKLGDAHARWPDHGKSEEELERLGGRESARIADLQQVLWADGSHALLIVLQGRDASGKDGAIRNVFTAVNPQGCTVSSFKQPTEIELRHDFLWRIHSQIPPKGMIGIFNRSHYEDILVPRVHGLFPKKVWSARYDQINDFERMLSENGVVMLKFMLHISRAEQKTRFEERISDETKNWKFRVGDLDDRKRWDDYTKAYRGILERTSTEWAPWYVVPADDKDVRNYLIARCIADTLESLDLHFPPPDPALKELVIE